MSFNASFPLQFYQTRLILTQIKLIINYKAIQSMKAVQIDKSQRKFTKPNSISSCLKCSICMDPFFMPTRLYCGHTFCHECINNCIKAKPNCPVCRTTIAIKNAGKDLLAYNIINELQVFCLYEDCSWRGELGFLELHLDHECLHHTSSQTMRHQPKNEIFLKPTVDEEVEEKINENIKKGCLISRAIMNDDSLKAGGRFDVAVKMLKTESNINNESVTAGKKNKKNQNDRKENVKQVKQDQDNFDFLMELYE